MITRPIVTPVLINTHPVILNLTLLFLAEKGYEITVLDGIGYPAIMKAEKITDTGKQKMECPIFDNELEAYCRLYNYVIEVERKNIIP